MAKHVLVNALTAKTGGLRNFMVNLLRNLAVDGRVTVLLPPETARAFKAPRNVRIVPLAYLPDSRVARIAFEQIVLPLWALLGRYDVLVTASSFGPRVPLVKHIVFLRNGLYFSQDYQRMIEDDPAALRMLRLYQTLVRATLAGADRIAVLQPAMIDEVKHFLGDVTADFAIVPNALPEPEGTIRDEVRALAQRFPERNVVNLVQYYHRYRNMEIVLDALEAFREPERIALVLGVDRGEEPPFSEQFLERAERLGSLFPVVNFGRVSLAEVYELYRLSDVALFPSLCEAFSITYVMAMHVGTPVIASDRPFSRAICGEAAIYFDPHNATDLRARINDVFKNQALRNQMIDRGRAHAARYTWEKSRDAWIGAVEA